MTAGPCHRDRKRRRRSPAFWGALAAAAVAACGSKHADAVKDAGPRDAARDVVHENPHGVCSADAGAIMPAGHVDVLTQHNDSMRTGQNRSEYALTTANVNPTTFGKLFTLPVDDLIYAQPLVVTSISVGGKMRDVLIVATTSDSVYAFDADDEGPPLWHVSLGPKVPSTDANIGQASVNLPSGVGILSTPVIDRGGGYIYVSDVEYPDQKMTSKLHVLSLATGEEEPGSPVVIAASTQGVDDAGAMATVTFDSHQESQRPGLLLLGGTVYVAFASYGDTFPFYGWVLGYRYENGSLTQTHSWISTPGGAGGGFWNSGQGLLSDGASIYGVTSNGMGGTPSGKPPSYFEAFVKLSPDLDVQDWFVPYNYEELNEGDIDLGAAGPLLVPGTCPLLMVGGGKQGILYAVDTTNMGHQGTTDDMSTQWWNAVPPQGSIYGGPVLWTGDGLPRLYQWATNDFLKEFVMQEDGLFDTTPAAQGPVMTVHAFEQDPAGILAVSSNGGTAGTGIVWGVKPLINPDHKTVPGTLYAFDALTLRPLWWSTQNAARDDFGNYAKFVPPTVANGKVYMATHSNAVFVYGLLAGADGGK